MTKLTFKMTAEEFYLGWKYKLKKNNFNNIKPVFIIPLLILLSIIFTKNYFYFVYFFFFAGLIIFNNIMQKKSIISHFYSLPNMSGEQTVVLYDEGIEFINSYEKMFVPWQSIFAVKQDSGNLIIVPTFRKGMFVINKERYKGSELDALISALQRNVKIEEGRK